MKADLTLNSLNDLGEYLANAGINKVYFVATSQLPNDGNAVCIWISFEKFTRLQEQFKHLMIENAAPSVEQSSKPSVD